MSLFQIQVLIEFKFVFMIGGRQADDIVAWVKKKTGPPAITVTSAEQAKELIAANNVIIFGFFSDQETERAKVYLALARVSDDQVFAIVSDDKVIKELEAQEGDIVLFKNVSVTFIYCFSKYSKSYLNFAH